MTNQPREYDKNLTNKTKVGTIKNPEMAINYNIFLPDKNNKEVKIIRL